MSAAISSAVQTRKRLIALPFNADGDGAGWRRKVWMRFANSWPRPRATTCISPGRSGAKLWSSAMWIDRCDEEKQGPPCSRWADPRKPQRRCARWICDSLSAVSHPVGQVCSASTLQICRMGLLRPDYQKI